MQQPALRLTGIQDVTLYLTNPCLGSLRGLPVTPDSLPPLEQQLEFMTFIYLRKGLQKRTEKPLNFSASYGEL